MRYEITGQDGSRSSVPVYKINGFPRSSVPVIEKHGCLRMFDDVKNGRLQALIQPHRRQGVKGARAAYPTYYEVRIS